MSLIRVRVCKTRQYEDDKGYTRTEDTQVYEQTIYVLSDKEDDAVLAIASNIIAVAHKFKLGGDFDA